MRTLLLIALCAATVPVAPLLAQENDRDSTRLKGPFAFFGNPDLKTYTDAVDSLNAWRKRTRTAKMGDCLSGDRNQPMVVNPGPPTPLVPGAWHSPLDKMPGSKVSTFRPSDCRGYRFLGPVDPMPPSLGVISTPPGPPLPAKQP